MRTRAQRGETTFPSSAMSSPVATPHSSSLPGPTVIDKIGLALMCPITSHVRDYPFKVPSPPGIPIAGVILSDQVKFLDWRARGAEMMARLPEATMFNVLARLNTLLWE